jgi:nickel-dependent lactate racemase
MKKQKIKGYRTGFLQLGFKSQTRKSVMELEIQYGKEKITMRLPPATKILYPNAVQVRDEKVILHEALRNPFLKEDFDEFMRMDEEILIVVNDATRPTPTSRILDVLYPKIKDKRVRMLVACGSHKAPTEDEFRFIFGKYYDIYKRSIHAHDAQSDPMTYFGKTSRGTEIFLNKIFADALRIILINSVEPHYFAGYTGGRKSILPGVSSYATIEQNHRFALSPSSRLLALKGNPVSDDMCEVASHVRKEMFSIQTVLDREGRIYAACCGDLDASFRKAQRFADEICMVHIDKKVDIVITVAPHPMDINLYQSQKAMENGKLALKEGGILILVSECGKGVGPRDFFDLLASEKSPQEVLKRIEKEYVLGYHKAAKMAELVSQSEVWAVTSLPHAEIRKAFIKPYNNLQNAIDDALSLKGKDASVTVLTDGAMTVPSLEK